MKNHLATLMMVVATLYGSSLAATDFESALDRARQLATEHHYGEVIELLSPFNAQDDPEIRYITAAEIGRAYFHLGRYMEAHRAFREAVRLRPDRAETAIYLEATSYLVGDVEQAYTILRELLKSGARDLYLAVTLPGERVFLADRKVHDIIEEYAVDLPIDVDRARVFDFGLGTERSEVISLLDARSGDPESPTLTASAGPAVIWAFIFDTDDELQEVLLQTEHLYRYTPYRLRFDDRNDWTLTPASAIASWGPPSVTSEGRDGEITLTWQHLHHRLSLVFARPRAPRPPDVPEGAAFLHTVRLTRTADQ